MGECNKEIDNYGSRLINQQFKDPNLRTKRPFKKSFRVFCKLFFTFSFVSQGVWERKFETKGPHK